MRYYPFSTLKAELENAFDLIRQGGLNATEKGEKILKYNSIINVFSFLKNKKNNNAHFPQRMDLQNSHF